MKDKFGCTRNGRAKFHAGVDLGAQVGTPCYAVAAGRIEEVGFGRDLGRYVSLSFVLKGRIYGVAYCHLENTTVAKGDNVTAGDKLGLTGITGNASADNPHLHLEVQDQVWVAYADAASRARHALDPNAWVR